MTLPSKVGGIFFYHVKNESRQVKRWNYISINHGLVNPPPISIHLTSVRRKRKVLLTLFKPGD